MFSSPNEPWQRNLYVLWIGEFFMTAGMSLVIPFLPLYISQLGVHQIASLEVWSGLIFSATFMISVFAQPVWGRLADRVGRKIMLIRSGIGMALIMASMGLVQNVWELFALRALMGSVAGFIAAAIALQATQTPEEHAGRALGILQTGAVAGNLLGPFIGGALSETIGIRHVFFLTGGFQMVAAILVILFVRENFVPDPAANSVTTRDFFRRLADTRIILPLFVVTLVIQLAYLSIEPIVTIYVHLLMPHTTQLALISGATFAAIGIGNMISAPPLGKLADRVGSQKILWWSIMAAAILYIPQAFVRSAYELMALRLILGLAVGGLQPSVQALIRRHAPKEMLGRAYGFNTSFMQIGNLVGPNLGGFVSSVFGIPSIFFVTSALLMLDSLWIYQVILRPQKAQLSITQQLAH